MGSTPTPNGSSVTAFESDHHRHHQDLLSSTSINFGTAEALDHVRSLTDVGAMTRLLHECIAYQRALDLELDSLLSQRSDLDKHLLHLQKSADVLHIVKADSDHMLSNISSTADLADHVSGKVRELDLAQSRVNSTLLRLDAIVERGNCIEGVKRALETEDYEAAANYVQTFLQIDEKYKDSGSEQREQLMESKKKLEGIVRKRLSAAVDQRDHSTILRFIRLYTPLGLEEEGLQVYVGYLRKVIGMRSRLEFEHLVELMDQNVAGGGQTQANFVGCLTNLFKDIVLAVEENSEILRSLCGEDGIVYAICELQEECDTRGSLILKKYMEYRKLPMLSSDINAQNKNLLAVGGSPEGPDPREVELYLEEILSLMQLGEDYTEFMVSKIKGLTSVDAELVPRATKAFRSGSFSKVVQEITGFYVILEGFFMVENVRKAIRIDEHVPDSLTTSMVDDVFYVLQSCLRRAISTSNISSVIAVLSSASSLLSNEYHEALQQKMREANLGVKQFLGGAGVQKTGTEIATVLNNMDVSCEYVLKLKHEIEEQCAEVFPAPGDREKVKSCLSELGDMSNTFKQSLTAGMEQIVSTVESFFHFRIRSSNSLCLSVHSKAAWKTMRKLSSSKDSSNMETRFLASSIRNLLPRSMSSSSSSFSKLKTNSNPKNPKSNIENTPPIDPNIQIDHGQTNSPLLAKQLPSDMHKSKPEIAGSYADPQETVPSDAPVKVVVRIKPANDGARDGDGTIKKVSSDSVSVGDRRFTFDSVFDSKANQGDVFQLVGVPLVKNALAGYNTSIVSYGQSGSGKTYTMWGPPSAMVEDPSPHSQQGIVPRTFQMLFSEIDKERQNSEGKQINYQCRCSFLEIYNEQIGDLLDPTQRRLEIKDDPKNGLFVENLTEEYVTSYEDVIQILIKGLSSRKVGATSVNSKSSRSHIVFTFFIESWCKETSSKCFGSSKTSRISLVDLAGLDKNKIDDDAGRQCAREGKNVKKSLLRLGQLVNTLATKGPESGKSEDSLYKGSCLTQLLRESLGGNSKLTVICAISPDKNNNSEILRTLRFGERVKSVRNEPVVNEITEDDVNDLSDQIRQLKEELIRAKSTASNSVGGKYGHFQGWNVRESLNQLRVSLNRSLILPRIDHDSDEEVNVDEDDVNELRKQLDELRDSHEENSGDLSLNRLSIQVGESCETDLMSQDDINYPEETECEEINLETSENEIPHKENITLTENLGSSSKTLEAKNPGFRSSISISSCRPSILQEPTLSESPKIGKNHRKSVTISSSHSVSRNNVSDSSKINSAVLRQSLSQSENIRSSLQSSKIFPGPTESLAASLQRGLQIIDYHQRNSASNGTPVAFSFEHLTLKPCPEVDNTNASTTLLCASCRKQIQETDSNEVQDSLKTWIVAVDGAGKPMTDEATKDARNAMAEVTKREELENRCMEQAAKIEQLNQLIEQYKCEKHNSIVEDGQESNSRCLLSSKNEIIPFEESKDVDIHFLKDETKHFRCNSLDKHPEVIKENYEIKEVQNESVLGYGNNISFDANEKEELLKEIQLLRSKLKSQTDASPNKSTEKLRSSLLSRSIQLRKSGAYQNFSQEELERERERWTEMESDWISLTDELRIDLDAHRRRAEKVEMELKLEKQCTEELDDALQRSVLGHARFVEHYAELQEKYNDLAGKHRAIMEGIAEVKKAMAKAGKKGHGPRFAKSLAAELSAMRVERERERELLKKENKSLRIQLRDTAEAVHAAGELLVRLRETEHAASVAEENFTNMQQENEKLKKQMEKLKRKHKMELVTMKQYLAESKLPESALQPLYHEDSNIAQNTIPDDDQAWRAEFGAIYQDHY